MTITATSALNSDQSPKSQSHKPYSLPSIHSLRSSIFFILTFITLLILLQIQALKPHLLFCPSPSIATANLDRLRASVTFLPLKDLRFSKSPMSGHTWFMSSLSDTLTPGDPHHLPFPSPSSNNRLLCLSGHHPSDGTMNSYALAYPDALPDNATLLLGLTVVSDTYYDYDNIWHGLSAVVPVVSWHGRHGCGAPPARWVLYHWGELRREMGMWVKGVAESAMRGEVRIEGLEGSGSGGGAVCLEKAVVFRHNEGGMKRERREEVYDMIRCRAREYCNVTTEEGGGGDRSAVRMAMWFRSGGRSFKEEEVVVRIFEGECRKVEGCRSQFARPGNLTFCEQVKLMSETDVLISQHGAQLTNMLFMDKGSSVMEFYPKGWRELAGVGQYVYKWMTEWSGMRYQGKWRDPNGEECPHKSNEECFTFYKDGQIGHDAAFFANWTARVLTEMKAYKLSEESSKQRSRSSGACPCN